MTDITVCLSDLILIIIVSVVFLAALLCAFTIFSRANRLDDDPPTISADEWWKDAERIKAAVHAAHEGGIERANLKRILED